MAKNKNETSEKNEATSENLEKAEVLEKAETSETAEVLEASEKAQVSENSENGEAVSRKETDFDMGMPVDKHLGKKELKAIDKKNKEILKKYHVSNVQIIKNYKTYTDAQKKHYRYIFGRRIMEAAWPFFRYALLFGLAFIVLYPILYMLVSSVKPQADTSDPSIMWIPKEFRFQNFSETFKAMNFPKVFANTMLINVGCSVLQVVTCAVTGYGFARFKFKGKNLLFGIVILQMIVPVQILMIPMYMNFRFFDIAGLFNAISGEPLNLVNSPVALFAQALFCNGIRAGLFILLFRQFFRGLPKELEDAAHLDGCGPIETFVRIMIPNAFVSFLTVFIFSVVWYWNDNYVSGMFYNGSDTLALAVDNLWRIMASYFNAGRVPSGAGPTAYLVWVQAGCLMSIAPIFVMYIALQKYFVEGIERSGIVG